MALCLRPAANSTDALDAATSSYTKTRGDEGELRHPPPSLPFAPHILTSQTILPPATARTATASVEVTASAATATMSARTGTRRVQTTAARTGTIAAATGRLLLAGATMKKTTAVRTGTTGAGTTVTTTGDATMTAGGTTTGVTGTGAEEAVVEVAGMTGGAEAVVGVVDGGATRRSARPLPKTLFLSRRAASSPRFGILLLPSLRASARWRPR